MKLIKTKGIFCSIITITILLFVGCIKNDPPKINSPEIDEIEVGNTIYIGFELYLDAGYNSSTVSVANGNVAITQDVENGEEYGIVYVLYKASSDPGVDYLTFTVYDNEGNEAYNKLKIVVVEPEKE